MGTIEVVQSFFFTKRLLPNPCIAQLNQNVMRLVLVRSTPAFSRTRQVTRATHVRNRVCPRVEFILNIIIILLIIFLGFIKSKPC